MNVSNLTTEQERAIIDAWFAEYGPKISEAVVDALNRLDGVADALTDIDAAGFELARQKVQAIILCADAVAAQYLSESFGRMFAASSDGLRATLMEMSMIIYKTDPAPFVDALIRRYLHT